MLTTFAARRLARAASCTATRSVNSGATPPVFRHFAVATRAASSDSGAVADAPAAGGRSVGTATPEKSGVQPLIDTQPVRGTRDFPPEDMRLRNWLFNHFREVRAFACCTPFSRERWAEPKSHSPCVGHQVSSLFGFEEWDAPVVESEGLYTRKAGEEITQQVCGCGCRPAPENTVF